MWTVDPYSKERQFAQRVRTKVLNAMLEAIEDDADINDTNKQAVTRALRNQLDSDNPENTSFIVELLTGLETDINSAASPYAGLNIYDRPDGLWAAAIAIIAIVLIFGAPIMLVAAVLYAGHRKRRMASDMASQFLANGQEVPPEVWRGLAGDASPRSNLHKGMTMMGVGLGIFLCFWLIGSMKAASLGLIPMFLGIAQLLIWKLEKQKAHAEE